MKKPITFIFLFLFTFPVIAQVSQERHILVIPRAEHPQIAKESGLGGRVTVYVNVDQAGNVLSVGDAIGPDNVCPAVTRVDVVALREAARSAAASAKFAAGSGEIPTTIPLNFDFPTREMKRAEGGDKEYTAVNATPANIDNASSGDRFTIKGDSRSTVKSDDKNRFGEPERPGSVPPPDYIGPVAVRGNNGGSASSGSSGSVPRQISGGVLNGKAMSLPKPSYPAAARAVRASGAVSIQVLIDEEGQIFSAAAVSGHPLLKSAARQAACGAAFLPTLLMGNPVKVSGIITYNFVP